MKVKHNIDHVIKAHIKQKKYAYIFHPYFLFDLNCCHLHYCRHLKKMALDVSCLLHICLILRKYIKRSYL